MDLKYILAVFFCIAISVHGVNKMYLKQTSTFYHVCNAL